MRTLVRRAMEMGFYEGVNLSLSYCDDCGHSELDMDVCPLRQQQSDENRQDERVPQLFPCKRGYTLK